ALFGGVAERGLVPAERLAAKLGAHPLVLVPLPDLLAQDLHARPDLAKDVGDADHLRLGVLQAVERLLAAELQTARAGGFLDDRAPVRRPQREDLIDEALADDDER